MTGFGRAEHQGARYAFEVVARSVNHRFLDLSLRLRDPCRASEPAIRALIASSILRGHLELSVEARTTAPDLVPRLMLREQLVRDLVGSLRRLGTELALEQGIDLSALLTLPGVIALETTSETWTASDATDLLSAVGGALAALVSAREAEGAALQRVMVAAASELSTFVAIAELGRGELRELLFERARERTFELLQGAPVDETRLLQELAHLAERTDIAEEVDRLRGHLTLLEAALSEDGPIGRRLDFLAQEIHRELNTLGVKCRDMAWATRIVDAKLACEQLREQAQNVE
jgi:uncharacterized protein (TIGR00255 family)